MIVVPSSSSEVLAKRISELTNSELSEVERKRFPDGEMYVRIVLPLDGQEVAVVGNSKTDAELVEFLLLLNAASEAGAKKITAVVPYFGYARQHRIYKPGEPVSSKVMTRAIEEFCDRIISIELHDPETLSYASVHFANLSIIDTMSRFFAGRNIDLLLSPDDGGFERARRMAEIIGIPAYFIDKKRIDSKTVEMHLPKVDFMGKSVLLVDDIISTGGTIIKAVKLLRESGASRISVSAVHGVFAKESDQIISSLVDELVVSDTLSTPFSDISVAGDISKSLIEGE